MQTPATGILHYIYDPLCGWCYGAAPLLDALANHDPELPLQLHAGGLLTAQPVDEQMAKFIRQHDARIRQLSRQPFGDEYLHGLLEDRSVVFDSARVIAALLAMEEADPVCVLPLLKRIQQAHYVEGLRICDAEVMSALLASLQERAVSPYLRLLAGLEISRAGPVYQHITATRRMMAALGIGGFPAFVVERAGEQYYLDHRPYYGDPQAFLGLVQPYLQAGRQV